MLKQSATFSLYILSIPYFKLSTLMNNLCVHACARVCVPRVCVPRVCVCLRVCAPAWPCQCLWNCVPM